MAWILGRGEDYPLKLSVIEDRVPEKLSRRVWYETPRPDKLAHREDAEDEVDCWVAEIQQTRNLDMAADQHHGVGAQGSRPHEGGARRGAG